MHAWTNIPGIDRRETYNSRLSMLVYIPLVYIPLVYIPLVYIVLVYLAGNTAGSATYPVYVTLRISGYEAYAHRRIRTS
jgi:hypothetical protein